MNIKKTITLSTSAVILLIVIINITAKRGYSNALHKKVDKFNENVVFLSHDHRLSYITLKDKSDFDYSVKLFDDEVRC